MLDRIVLGLLRLVPAGARRRLSFAWRYRRGNTPWDTNQSPPELEAFVRAQVEPGRALDLGCGTGTNVIFLARQGWEATGVDYVAQAVEAARTKAGHAGVAARFLAGDVSRLDDLPLDGPFDLLLDIGCMHSLDGEARRRYAAQLARLARPGATYMLYAAMPRRLSSGLMIGITPDEVATLFAPHFTVERAETGEDSGAGWERGWYWLRRAAP